MATAKSGDEVSVHYKGTLDDGSLFDSSDGREPLQFTLGKQQVIAGFDVAVEGMGLGETKTVRIPAQEAYGDRDEELVHTVGRSQMPAELTLRVGQTLRGRNARGAVSRMTVVAFDDENVTLDGNHPLAGEALTFEIKLISIS